MQSNESAGDTKIPQTQGNPESPNYISVKDTAALLNVGRQAVYRRFHADVFPGRKVGRKIDILRPFVDAVLAEIRAGCSVDVDEFARQWRARQASAAVEAVAA